MIRLLHGDCYTRFKEIPDNSIDLIVMDPPYKQSGSAGAGCFGGNNVRYYYELEPMSDGISTDILDECVRVLKKVNIYVYCNKSQLLFYLSYFDNIDRDVNFNLLCWHKTNPIPATKNIYLRDTEYILFFREKGVPLRGTYATKKTYFVTPVNISDKKLYHHPTVKPIGQSEIFIQNSSDIGDTVLDPFMGTCTVGAACKKLGRNFIGIELDRAHFKTAKNRIKSMD